MKRVAMVIALCLCCSVASADPVTERTADFDTGSNSVPTEIKGIAIPGSGGPAAVSATNPLPTTPAPRCGATHLKTVRTAPSGSNVSLTLTGMCSSGTCYGCTVENIDAANACVVAFNASDASAGRILYSVAHPTLASSYDSWAHESSVTSIRVATSGISDPESRTIGACDLQVTCCGL